MRPLYKSLVPFSSIGGCANGFLNPLRIAVLLNMFMWLSILTSSSKIRKRKKPQLQQLNDCKVGLQVAESRLLMSLTGNGTPSRLTFEVAFLRPYRFSSKHAPLEERSGKRDFVFPSAS